jgi:hypothetical protein
MWDTLERARRRFLGGEAAPDPNAAPGGSSADALIDLSFALGRGELERLIGTLEVHATPDRGRPDTPARLQAALDAAIGAVAGLGRPVVTRRPAAVYTPETWQIDVLGADSRTRIALETAIRGGGIA